MILPQKNLAEGLSESGENYLKAIYRLSHGNTFIKPKTLIEYLPYAPSTTTLTLQSLAKRGYIEYQKYRGVRLTEKGIKKAAQVLRAHRLLEVLFFNYLGLDIVKTHVEACKAEHVFARDTISHLERFLNFPKKCPHGNDIPNENLEIPTPNDIPLTKASKGIYYVSRIAYETEQILGMLSQIGLIPGVMLEVITVDRKNKIVLIRTGEQTQILPFKIAKILNVYTEKQ